MCRGMIKHSISGFGWFKGVVEWVGDDWLLSLGELKGVFGFR